MNIKNKAIQLALKKFAGIILTEAGVVQFLVICEDLQKLIDIIKSGK